jgi:hypothetical protein
MKEFIGHDIKVGTRTMGILSGQLLGEDATKVLLKGKDGVIVRIFKSDIGGYCSLDFEPLDVRSFLVLYCQNQKSGCQGVQYVKEGNGFSQSDLEIFTSPCESRCRDCIMGSKGELRGLSGEFLSRMISGTRFGEYPTDKGVEHDTTRDSETNREASESKKQGRGTVKRKKPIIG